MSIRIDGWAVLESIPLAGAKAITASKIASMAPSIGIIRCGGAGQVMLQLSALLGVERGTVFEFTRGRYRG